MKHLYHKQINIKTNDIRKQAKNAFGKHANSKSEIIFTLFVLSKRMPELYLRTGHYSATAVKLLFNIIHFILLYINSVGGPAF